MDVAVYVIVASLLSSASGWTDESGSVHGHRIVKRVIGGAGFAQGKWPWLVSLQGKIPTRMLFNRIPLSYQRFYCGASLLNDRWILTAAHCFNETNLGERAMNPRYWHAKLGEVELRTSVIRRLRGLLGRLLNNDDMRHWQIHAERIVIHPNYTHSNMWKNDIALVKLAQVVPSGIDDLPRIQKITLNSAGMAFPPAGHVCYMKGWGCTDNGGPVTRTAREIRLPVVSNQDCEQLWGIPATLRLCAGHSSSASLGICSGDSGGPLVCHNGREWIQVGVASFTSASRPGNVPGVFTRVSSYVPWIRDVMVDDWTASLAQTTTPAGTSRWSLRNWLRLSDNNDDDQ